MSGYLSALLTSSRLFFSLLKVDPVHHYSVLFGSHCANVTRVLFSVSPLSASSLKLSLLPAQCVGAHTPLTPTHNPDKRSHNIIAGTFLHSSGINVYCTLCALCGGTQCGAFYQSSLCLFSCHLDTLHYRQSYDISNHVIHYTASSSLF